jgi:glycosyltransferase involved in cell wall biosynthesis
VHVAHIIDRLDGIGGVQTYLSEVVPGLATRGVRSTMLVGRPDANGKFVGAAIIPLPEAQQDGARISPQAAARITDVVRDVGADVCLVHVAPSPAVPAAASLSAPTIVFAHDYFPACPGNARYLHSAQRFCNEGPGARCFHRAFTERCTNRRPDRLLRATSRERAWRHAWSPVARILVASSFVAEVLVADGAPRDRLDIVPYFVTPSDLAPAAVEKSDVLFVGRLVPLKGVDVLVRAIAQLPGVTATIAGEGPERPALEALTCELGAEDRIRFGGEVQGERRAALLHGARIFAMPSLWDEPFGIAGLEALAAGVPVVATDAGGIPSWLPDGKVGMRVARGDSRALAEAIGRILRDDALRGRMSEAGRSHAAWFSLDRHLTMLEDALAAARHCYASPA